MDNNYGSSSNPYQYPNPYMYPPNPNTNPHPHQPYPPKIHMHILTLLLIHIFTFLHIPLTIHILDHNHRHPIRIPCMNISVFLPLIFHWGKVDMLLYIKMLMLKYIVLRWKRRGLRRRFYWKKRKRKKMRCVIPDIIKLLAWLY
jgi:hypothetical protein